MELGPLSGGYSGSVHDFCQKVYIGEGVPYVHGVGGYPMYIGLGGTLCTKGRGVPYVHRVGGTLCTQGRGVPYGAISRALKLRPKLYKQP